MQRMKPLLYVCYVLLMGSMYQTLNAQKVATSPFTIGFDVGFAFNSSTDSVETAVNAQFLQLRSNYRFTRWLGLSASLNYANVSSSSDFFNSASGLSRSGAPSTWVTKTHRIPVVIGPELSIRVGQGDLSIAAQFGFIYNQSKVVLNDPFETYTLQYTPTLDTYNNLSFHYTYWPQQHFGVRIGIQFQDWLSSNYSVSELNSTSQQEHPDLEPDIINRIRPSSGALEFELLQIGLTYRL